MGKVNGVPVTSISSINNKELSTITNFMGVSTSLISGWPLPSGCVTYSLAYRNSPPIGPVCSDSRNDYLFDAGMNILYGLHETCGGNFAPSGFYSDGVLIYNWDETTKGWVWNIIGPCN